VIAVRGSIGLIWTSSGPLIPLIMAEYGISRGSAGWFASAAPMTIALVSIPIGMIGARFAVKRTFFVGALLQAAGMLAPFCPDYFTLLLTRVAFAVGTAVTVPIGTAIAAQWFSSRHLPMVNGVTMAVNRLAGAAAFAATVPLAMWTTWLSWKMPIVVYGAFALTCSLAWLIFGRESPEAPVKATAAPSAASPHDLSFKQVIRMRPTLLLAFAVMGSWGLGNAVGAWLPAYYVEVFGMRLDHASSILAFNTIAATIACILGGIIPMQLGRRRPLLILSGGLMGISAMAAVLFNNPISIYVSVILFGILVGLETPSLFTIPMELPGMTVRSRTMVISVMQVGGNLGNFMAPLAVGYLADVTGSYLPGLFIFAALSLNLLLAGLFLPETGPKGKAAAAALQAGLEATPTVRS
jgi:MFS family permease